MSPVPTPHGSERESARSYVRSRPATAEVMVQIIGDAPRRGLKAEASELERFRRTYEQAAQPLRSSAPNWERCA